jgi:putative effector of murein hydrolase
VSFGSAAQNIVVFSGVTILLYALTRKLHIHLTRWWTSPVFLTPIVLVAIALTFHISYSNYIHATHWLMLFLGPVTVAFAVPIYKHRKVIVHNWPLLAVCLVVGSFSAVASSWVFATILGLDPALRLSLLPRYMSTPFAMVVSGSIGGSPDITAVFVAITGICGAGIGEAIIQSFPIRSSLAKGALLGMGAHGVGVAKAKQIGQEEASIAGLLMVFVGLVNVLLAPLASSITRHFLHH